MSTRRSRSRPRRAPAGLLVGACVAVSAACGGAVEQRVTARPADAFDDLAQPAIRGAVNGLEMRVWAVQDQDELIAELLDTYGVHPTPMPDSIRTAWRASGLRVLVMPAESLNAVRDRLVLIGPEQRDWFGQSPGWSEAVRGRVVEPGTTIRVADGLLTTPAGRLRILKRCWTVPGEPLPEGGVTSALHLELAVQLERRDAVPSIMDLPALQSELEAGVVFPRLAGTLRLAPDTALVIVPVEPEFGEQTEHQIGPPEPATPTLGEAMLTSLQPNTIAPARRRAIVVFLPRLPERFRVAGAPAEVQFAPAP